MGSTPLDDALEAAADSEIVLFGFDNAGTENFYNGAGSFGIGWSRRLNADERSRLQALMLELPDGVSARCHEPGFGLRFSWPRELHVSICFRCNNIFADPSMIAFDARSPQARELLTFLRSCAPPDWRAGQLAADSL